MNIYILKLNHELSYSELTKSILLDQISENRKNLFLRIKDEKKAISTLFSELFVRYCIYIEMKTKNINFKYNQYGKPYIDNGKFFNISHSNDIIILVIADEEVGVDIEYIKERDLSLANSIFSNQELNYLSKSEDKIRAFYELWTLKESYLKAVGIGLNKDLKSFDVLNQINYRFKTFYDIDDYIYSICSQKDEFFKKINVNQKEILDFFHYEKENYDS